MKQPNTSFTNHLPVRLELAEPAALRLPSLPRGWDLDRVALVLDGVASQIRHSGARAVVGLGGGSVIDTAKAARLCVRLGCTFSEFLASEPKYLASVFPLIAVPTSGGTGSEVSGGEVVTDEDDDRKSGIAHPHVRAQHAVVDLQPTRSMPPGMTAHVGIDALAQGIAALVAKVRPRIASSAIGLKAIRLTGRSLLASYRDGQNGTARSEMSCGSMMQGLAMYISDSAAERSLVQAIGGLTGAAHGLTIGLVLAETLERERQDVSDQVGRVAEGMGVPDDGSRDDSRLVRAIRELLADLEFPILRDLGVADGDLEQITDGALDDYFLTMSPHPWSRAVGVRSRRSQLVAS